MDHKTQLPAHLHDIRKRVEGYAREYGLDFFDTIFEVLNFDEINMVAAYGGFPNRYPHWRFGMEYERLSKGYEYGLSKIYEMVINNDPSYAYLLESNMDVDQKLVMAHVYGHVDFFKNNFMFRHTNRKMMDQMANHATRVRRYQDKLGVELVEDFIDRCLSLENLIDYQSPYVKRRPDHPEEDGERKVAKGFKTEREYMREFINPPEFLAAQQKRLDEEAARKRKFPERPERDVLLFLLEHAPLERWEHDVLSIIREEAYYFAPQGQTKIMNEGWATYWHSKIMTREGPRRLRDHRLRRPPLRHARDAPRPAQPLQARRRALARHRGSLEQGALRQGVRRLRLLRGAQALGQAPRPRPREDLRGPQALQRRHLHRRVPHAWSSSSSSGSSPTATTTSTSAGRCWSGSSRR